MWSWTALDFFNLEISMKKRNGYATAHALIKILADLSKVYSIAKSMNLVLFVWSTVMPSFIAKLKKYARVYLPCKSQADREQKTGQVDQLNTVCYNPHIFV